ncbi:MAG: hypothetical protein IPK13_18345 [Deltaproteobacteria bacterium]|nr:hypothetical protein [Deltaproteobacteria bacterium]
MTKKPPTHPLWRYMPPEGHLPPPISVPGRRPGRAPYQPRQYEVADVQPLRVDGRWQPQEILRVLGPGAHEGEYLTRLIVACALIQGVHRVRELTDRLLQLLRVASPRIELMGKEDGLRPRRPLLDGLAGRLKKARAELVQTRARATNDLPSEPPNPDGLRVVDLAILCEHVQGVILATEISTRRNVTGIDFATQICNVSPALRFAEDWLDRALGSVHMHGILLYLPPEYGRVLVVYDDGRLAYDPAAAMSRVDDRKTP